jgi:hypothetical protein
LIGFCDLLIHFARNFRLKFISSLEGNWQFLFLHLFRSLLSYADLRTVSRKGATVAANKCLEIQTCNVKCNLPYGIASTNTHQQWELTGRDLILVDELRNSARGSLTAKGTTSSGGHVSPSSGRMAD